MEAAVALEAMEVVAEMEAEVALEAMEVVAAAMEAVEVLVRLIKIDMFLFRFLNYDWTRLLFS